MEKGIITPPPAVVGNLCPELPAGAATDPLGRQGFVLQPCLGERCAKYFGCQVLPKELAKFIERSALKLS